MILNKLDFNSQVHFVYDDVEYDMLHDSFGGLKIVNDKLLKKKTKKFQERFSKFVCEKDALIDKLNESNKLVEKYKNFIHQMLHSHAFVYHAFLFMHCLYFEA